MHGIDFFGRDVGHRLASIGGDDGRLMLCGKETVAEQSHATVRDGGAAALQHHEARQVLVHRAEPVIHPRAGAGITHDGKSGVEKIIRLCVFVHLRGHRTDHRKVVRARFRDLGKHGADRDAAFAILLELKRAGENLAVVVELSPLHLHRHRLPGQLFQHWLGIKRINVRNAAGHVAKDHVLGARLEIGLGLAQRAEQILRHQSSQRQHAEARRTALEHFAAIDHSIHGVAWFGHRMKINSFRLNMA